MAQVLNLLRKLQKDMRLGSVFISHNINVVCYMSERIAVMYAGEIVEVGPTKEILSNPPPPLHADLAGVRTESRPDSQENGH